MTCNLGSMASLTMAFKDADEVPEDLEMDQHLHLSFLGMKTPETYFAELAEIFHEIKMKTRRSACSRGCSWSHTRPTSACKPCEDRKPLDPFNLNSSTLARIRNPQTRIPKP